MKGTSKGFTLIELLVVVAIIGMLSSVVLASLNTARRNARDAQREAALQQVTRALELYRLQYGEVPVPSSQNVSGSSCTTNTCLSRITASLVPTYMPAIPLDPRHGDTNTGYRYCRAASDTQYQLMMHNETINAWCTVQGPAPITGTACWTTAGVPMYGGWCP